MILETSKQIRLNNWGFKKKRGWGSERGQKLSRIIYRTSINCKKKTNLNLPNLTLPN